MADDLRQELLEQAIELERQERKDARVREMSDQITERRKVCDCKHEASIQSLKASEISMQKSLDGVSVKLDLILAQITKVAVLEEKHSNQVADINRAHKYIQDLEGTQRADVVELRKNINDLAIEARAFINQAKGMWAIIAIIGGTMFALLIKILFFMGAGGVT